MSSLVGEFQNKNGAVLLPNIVIPGTTSLTTQDNGCALLSEDNSIIILGAHSINVNGYCNLYRFDNKWWIKLRDYNGEIQSNTYVDILYYYVKIK